MILNNLGGYSSFDIFSLIHSLPFFSLLLGKKPTWAILSADLQLDGTKEGIIRRLVGRKGGGGV